MPDTFYNGLGFEKTSRNPGNPQKRLDQSGLLLLRNVRVIYVVYLYCTGKGKGKGNVDLYSASP